MKIKNWTKLFSLTIPLLLLSLSLFLSNCKGHVEIFDIQDSVKNCSAPYVVYFYPEAKHRTKKLEYTWDFGDGTTSHEKKPVHIYQKSGMYKVTLSIKQNKSFDTKTISLNLTEAATAVYSDWDYASYNDSLWAPSKIEFQNYSKFATSYLWNFGDEDTSTKENPEHVYENPGIYTCLLNAICQEDTSKFLRDIVIKPAPHKIDILDISLRMPDKYIGSNIDVDIYYKGFLEKSVGASNVEGFPITFNVRRTLFYFNGNYNTDELIYKVYSSIGDGSAEATFVLKARDLQLDFYPTLLSFDDLEGIQMQSAIGYRQ